MSGPLKMLKSQLGPELRTDGHRMQLMTAAAESTLQRAAPHIERAHGGFKQAPQSVYDDQLINHQQQCLLIKSDISKMFIFVDFQKMKILKTFCAWSM